MAVSAKSLPRMSAGYSTGKSHTDNITMASLRVVKILVVALGGNCDRYPPLFFVNAMIFCMLKTPHDFIHALTRRELIWISTGLLWVQFLLSRDYLTQFLLALIDWSPVSIATSRPSAILIGSIWFPVIGYNSVRLFSRLRVIFSRRWRTCNRILKYYIHFINLIISLRRKCYRRKVS